MSWSGLTSTQWVSRDNLQNAVDTLVLTQLAPIPPGPRWVTKYDVQTYVDVNPANVYLSPKAGNQWVAKRDLTPAGGGGGSPMAIQATNQTGTNMSNFTISLNGINVPGLTGIALNTSSSASGTATNALSGADIMTVSNSGVSFSIISSDIKDAVTLTSIPFSYDGPGVAVNISISFSGGNITNGITIRVT